MKDTYLKWRSEMLRLLPIFALLLLALAGFWWSGVSAEKRVSPLNDENDSNVALPADLRTVSAN